MSCRRGYDYTSTPRLIDNDDTVVSRCRIHENVLDDIKEQVLEKSFDRRGTEVGPLCLLHLVFYMTCHQRRKSEHASQILECFFNPP